MGKLSRVVLEAITAGLILALWFAPLAAAGYKGFQYATADDRGLDQR